MKLETTVSKKVSSWSVGVHVTEDLGTGVTRVLGSADVCSFSPKRAQAEDLTEEAR